LIIELDGAKHARIREMVTAEFTVRRVEAMRGYIQKVVDSHLDAMLEKSGRADLVQDFALPIPSQLLCVPYADRKRFQRHSTTLVTAERTPEQQQAALEGHVRGLAERRCLKWSVLDVLRGSW
jgi:cytochrome P450